jgi:hypothetical protein
MDGGIQVKKNDGALFRTWFKRGLSARERRFGKEGLTLKPFMGRLRLLIKLILYRSAREESSGLGACVGAQAAVLRPSIEASASAIPRHQA